MSGCPICKAIHDDPAASFDSQELAGDVYVYNCQRCGTYLLDSTLRNLWKTQPPDSGTAIRLSGTVKLRSTEAERLVLTRQDYRKLAEAAPIPTAFAGYEERFLSDIAERTKFPGAACSQEHISAWAAPLFLSVRDFETQFLPTIVNRGLISATARDVNGYVGFKLEPSSWARVDELRRRGPQGNRAFVAMSFSEALRPVYEAAIEPSLIECGYELPFRVDDKRHEADHGKPDYQPKIDDRIMAGIRRARFVVVDITERRPAVYYEAGFADGLGIPVIWTGKADTFDADKIFDTQQFPHIVWEDPADLREQLTERIRARGWDRNG